MRPRSGAKPGTARGRGQKALLSEDPLQAGSGSEPVRVLFYTASREWGGAERVLEVLLAHLPASFEACVVSVDERVSQRLVAARPGTSAVLLPPPRRRLDWSAALRLRRTLVTARPDVVHVNLAWPLDAFEALVATRMARVAPLVLHEHMPLPMKTPVHMVVKRTLSHHVDAHVVVGERAADDLAQAMRVSRRQLHVIPNGIPLRPAPPREQHHGAPTVLAMGRITEQKGFDVLVRALALVPGLRLVVAGVRHEDEAETLRALAAHLGVGERVELVPWQTDPAPLLAQADLYCVSSRWESGPLVLLEALAAGLPVVATDVGIVPEVLACVDPALIVPVGDVEALARALSRLVTDEALRRDVARRARGRVVAEYDARVMAARFAVLYDRLATGQWAARARLA